MTVKDYDFIVLDCDGVIFDSNTAKVSAFFETALEFGIDTRTARRMSRWQEANFGTSRYVVFERLLAGDFGVVSQWISAERLLESYATKVRDIYDSVSVTQGLREFLDAHINNRLYVASGSDETELSLALSRRGLAANFEGIFGSPQPKQAILESIRHQESTERDVSNGLMIGDARADYAAASACGLDFMFVARYSTVRSEMEALARDQGFRVVETLEELL